MLVFEPRLRGAPHGQRHAYVERLIWPDQTPADLPQHYREFLRVDSVRGEISSTIAAKPAMTLRIARTASSRVVHALLFYSAKV
jgi:hypothetical protein